MKLADRAQETGFRRAAALATGCRIEIKQGSAYFDLHQNPLLGAFVFSTFCQLIG
jgi:hypothetical protein